MLYSLGYTVEYWIQQKQLVEFDGFGTHGYMLYSLGYTMEYWIQQKQPVEFDGFWCTWLHALFTGPILWSTESIKSSRWSLMDLVHMATCSIHWAILWSTESNKSSRWSLMDLVHMASCSIHWAILWSTESNKSSRWSLMDLVHMAACSIRWAILWSTESIKIRQNQEVHFGVVRVKEGFTPNLVITPKKLTLKAFSVWELVVPKNLRKHEQKFKSEMAHQLFHIMNNNSSECIVTIFFSKTQWNELKLSLVGCYTNLDFLYKNSCINTYICFSKRPGHPAMKFVHVITLSAGLENMR